MKIQRVRCKSCDKTHALLPMGIIPYKQVTLEVIISIIQNIINTSLEKTADIFSISISTIKKYWYDFKKHHLSRLNILTKTRNLSNSLYLLNESIQLQVDYITHYNRCFMQIKLGWIGVKALHEGPPT